MSRDPSENHSNMLIIINVENICAAKYFGETMEHFFSGFFIRLFEIEIFCNNINLFNVILINLLHAWWIKVYILKKNVLPSNI